MKKNMHKTMMATILVSSLLVPNLSYAAQQEKHGEQEQLIGFGSGLVLGAIVGGPVGAVIGAFTGGIVGKTVADDDKIDDQTAKIAYQQQQLADYSQHKAEYAALTARYGDAKKILDRLSAQQQDRLNALVLGMNVQFKTGSAKIESIYKAQLNEVAQVLKESPELQIDLTGFADRTGNAATNQALSEKRLANVKQYLLDKGINKSRLTSKAYGDQAPVYQTASLENNVFDRRVTIKLAPESEMALTAQK
ncbi:MAG: sortase-associated OmpA-like protein PdsO [Parashewanella sp.]